GCELARHRILAALARRLDDPAHRQRHAPRRTHFDRNLIRRAADAARFHFDRGRNVAKRLFDEADRLGVLLADGLERAVHDLLRDRLLTALHHHVDEASDDLTPMLGIRQQDAGWSLTFAR